MGESKWTFADGYSGRGWQQFTESTLQLVNGFRSVSDLVFAHHNKEPLRSNPDLLRQCGWGG